jgi:thiol-disulfide isomerase/thioredoxin
MSEPISEPSPQSPPAPPTARVARVALLLAVAAALGALLWPHESSPAAGRLGGFLLDEDGHATAVASTFGPATLIHFWASWCPPCKDELPKLVAFARQRSNDRLKVVFVAVADQPLVARRFLAAPDIALKFDPTWDVAHRFGTEQLPETHLVVDGRIVESFIGPANWDDPALADKLQKWIASPTKPTP